MRHALASTPGPVVEPASEVHHSARVTAAAAALATLTIIAVSAMLGATGPSTGPGPGPDQPRVILSELARHALSTLPAYQLGENVIVFGNVDRHIAWTDPVPLRAIEGHAVPLQGGALADYSSLPLRRSPSWIHQLTPADHVYAELGPLFLACVVETAGQPCAPVVLTYHDTRYFLFDSDLGPSRVPAGTMQVFAFDSVNGTERSQLLVGRVGGTAVSKVRVTRDDGLIIPAATSAGIAVPDESVWTVQVPGTARQATAYTSDGHVIARALLTATRCPRCPGSPAPVSGSR